ncbi:DNA-directed DNA polymerase [Tanacetum coccineum]
MTETMEQYMSKTRGNYGSGVVRPMINDKTHFELKGQYLKELRKNTFSGSEHEDANEHIKKVLEVFDLFHIPEILDSKGAIPTKTAADSKIAIQEMSEYSQKWHNGTSSKTRRLHYTKECPLKEEGNTLEEAYYTHFGAPYQPAGKYRAAGPRFYQRNNVNSSYPDQRQTLEESLTKFMAESAKRHEENSNIIKEIRAFTDASIRNQGASIKTLDHVKSISTAIADSFEICRMGCNPYAVSGSQHKSIFSKTVPFPRQLQNYYYDDWREAQDVKILEAYDHTLPQKEKDPGRASVSVMPFSTYSNLGLGILSHTRLTIELADRTIKQPRGIAENMLVRIGKFIFPIDFIILDIPKDDDVPLILGRPFLSTAHSKIDVYKRKITLRVGEEKLVFKSIKPATRLIRRFFMLKDLD